MQNPIPRQVEPVEHLVEVTVSRLITAHLLGRDHLGEVDPELTSGLGEQVVVHVGHDSQAVPSSERC